MAKNRQVGGSFSFKDSLKLKALKDRLVNNKSVFQTKSEFRDVFKDFMAPRAHEKVNTSTVTTNGKFRRRANESPTDKSALDKSTVDKSALNISGIEASLVE